MINLNLRAGAVGGRHFTHGPRLDTICASLMDVRTITLEMVYAIVGLRILVGVQGVKFAHTARGHELSEEARVLNGHCRYVGSEQLATR